MSIIGPVSGSNGWARRRRVEAVRRAQAAERDAPKPASSTALIPTDQPPATSERVSPDRRNAPLLRGAPATYHVHGAPRGLKADQGLRQQWHARYAAPQTQTAPTPSVTKRLIVSA